MSKWKMNLLFGAALPAAIAFSIGLNLLTGEHFREAAWSALREIKPFEVLMLIGFWYGCVFDRLREERSSSLIKLNLNSRD